MKRYPIGFFLLILTFIACMGGAAILQHHEVEAWGKRPFRFRGALYLPASGYVRAVAVGYDQFVADFLWLRMIQTFASAWTVPECAPVIQNYFRVISDLDPKFVDPYSFAIMGVGEEGKRPDWVKEIVDKSILKIPGNSKITYEGAFFANWKLNDQDLAKYYVRMAKLDPAYPEFIDRWEGYFDLKQGRFRAAYEKYLTDYLHAIAADNTQLYSILEANLRRVIDSWFKSEIKSRAVEWHKEKAVYPTVAELNAANRFKEVQLPDVYLLERFIKELLGLPVAQRKVVTDKTIANFADQAVHSFDRLPPGPYDLIWPDDPGYTIWHNFKPEEDNFVLSGLEALTIARQTAVNAGGAAQEWKEKHGGQCPPDVQSFAPELLKFTDPFNQAWVWDNKKCVLGTTKYPDLEHKDMPGL